MFFQCKRFANQRFGLCPHPGGKGTLGHSSDRRVIGWTLGIGPKAKEWSGARRTVLIGKPIILQGGGIAARSTAEGGRRRRRLEPGLGGQQLPLEEIKESCGCQPRDARIGQYPAGLSVVVEGEYWEGASDLCGLGVGAVLDGYQHYLKLRATGTHSEVLLKFLSGSPSREVQVHLCGDPRGAWVWKDGLLHASKIREVKGAREAWMDNLGSDSSRGDGRRWECGVEERSRGCKTRPQTIRRGEAAGA